MSIEQAEARFFRDPFAGFLGMQLVEIARERAVVCLPYQPEHANPVGPLNGGASASLLNVAGKVAAWTGGRFCRGLLSYRAPDYRGPTPRLLSHYTGHPKTAQQTADNSWLIQGYRSEVGHYLSALQPGPHPYGPAWHGVADMDARGRLHDGALASGQLVAMGQVSHRLVEPPSAAPLLAHPHIMYGI